jgi:hypothetical protein
LIQQSIILAYDQLLVVEEGALILKVECFKPSKAGAELDEMC